MNSNHDDITIFAINYFTKQAEKKGLTLKEFVEKLESEIKKISGEKKD